MKARVGKSVKGTTAKSAMGKTFSGYQKAFKTGVSAGQKASGTSTIVGVKPTLPEAAKSSKIARRALKAAQATRLGKMLLPVAAAGVAAQQFLKSKMKKKKEEPKKKMGGGMMKKYKSGGSAPMKKERLFEGDRGKRRNELIKKLRGAAKATPLGLGIKVAETAKKLKEKMSNKMGGGMMQRPMSYNIGGRAQTRGRAARKPSRQPQDAMAKRKFQKGIVSL